MMILRHRWSVLWQALILPEGDTTPFTFTVNRSITTGDNSTSQVTYTVAGSGANPANADDFAGALQGTLNFAQGVPSQTITVLVAGDSDVQMKTLLSRWRLPTMPL